MRLHLPRAVLAQGALVARAAGSAPVAGVTVRPMRAVTALVATAALGVVAALAVVTIGALLPDDDQVGEPVDMEQLRHDVAVMCGLDEQRLIEPDLWSGGASWRVAGTTRRPGISFGGEGVYCG